MYKCYLCQIVHTIVIVGNIKGILGLNDIQLKKRFWTSSILLIFDLVYGLHMIKLYSKMYPTNAT